MENKNKQRIKKLFINSTLLVSQALMANPSGTLQVPKDVEIPDGVRVSLFASTRSPKEIYVQPLLGTFLGNPSIAPSAAVDCSRIKKTLRNQTELNRQFEMQIKDSGIDLANYLSRKKGLQKVIDDLSVKASEITAREANLLMVKESLQNISSRINELNLEFVSVRDGLVTQTDPELIKQAKEKMDELKTELQVQAKERRNLTAELNTENRLLGEARLTLARLEGLKNSELKKLAEDNQVMAIFEQRRISGENEVAKVLDAAGKNVGAYLKLTMDFAPVEYLQRLQERNPNYTFQWVPSLGAMVDITFPMFKEGSAMATVNRQMILGEKHDDAVSLYATHPALAALFAKEPTGKDADPFAELQKRMLQFSNGMTGSKQVTLLLSELGYCGLMKPDSFETEYERTAQALNPDAVQTFGLTVHFAFPMHYDVKAHGYIYQNKILNELYKRRKSNSWFGLSKKDQQEFTRTFRDETFTSIKVDSSSPIFGPDQALALANTIKDTLVVSSIADFATFEKNSPKLQPGSVDEERGATTVGKSLVKFPNPWVMVSGLSLMALDSMFGSSVAEIKRNEFLTYRKDLRYDVGFTLPVSASLTVGNINTQIISIQ